MFQEALRLSASGTYSITGFQSNPRGNDVSRAIHQGTTREYHSFDLWFNTAGKGGLRFTDFSAINGGDPEIVFDTGVPDELTTEANIEDEDVSLYIRIKPDRSGYEVYYDFNIVLNNYVRTNEALDPS